MKYLNKNQVQEALRLCLKEGRKKNRERNYIILKVLSESGLRVTELIELTPYNINYEANTFFIKGKGDKIRVVDISPELSQLVQMYVKSKNIPNKKPIFPLTRDGIRKMTWKFAGANPHIFRHTYAINLLRRTKNIRYVQKQLGHSSLSTTEEYLQFVEYEEERKLLSGLMS